MKVSHSTGCLSYSTCINEKSLTLMDISEVIKLTNEFITLLPDTIQPSTLENSIDTIIDFCKNTVEKEVKYGDKEDEELYVSILDTKNHRIRTFYDAMTDNMWITIDNHFEFTFNLLKDVLLECVNEYITNPKFGEPDDIKTTVSQIIGDIVETEGVISYVGELCECCGDIPYTYELEL